MKISICICIYESGDCVLSGYMAFSAPRCLGFYQLWCKGAKFLICCWWWLAWAGFLGGTSGKEPSCQWRRLKRRGFDS